MLVCQEQSLINQRFGFQILENISQNESGSVNQNSRSHLKKLKKKESCNGSALSSLIKNSRAFIYSSDKIGSGSKDVSQIRSQDKASSLNLNYPNTCLSLNSRAPIQEIEEQKLNQSLDLKKLPELIEPEDSVK